jgi:fatty-acyl-CoA synthase
MSDYGVGSWPARRARIDGDAVALRQDDREITYRQLAQRVDLLASALSAMGVRGGDRVAYLAANDIAGFELFFAAGRLGAIFAPFNWRLSPPEIAYLVADCEPTVLVHAAEFTTTASELPLRAISLAAEYDDLMGVTNPAVGNAVVTLDDDAVILYTSGTTGHPKGAVLTHSNLTFNTMNQLAHADVLSTDTALCISPLFHATGLGQVSLPTLFKGGTVVVLPKFDPAVVLATIERLRIASFSAVPTMLQMLADHESFSQTNLNSLRYVIYGGSAVRERVAVAWQNRGVQILQGYGMTEASPGVTMAPLHGASDHPISIGVPHFFTDISFDPTEGSAPPGATGELLVRGPNVFRGYWRRLADTATALDGGWYHSGDVVSIGADGWAYIIDRVKDLIISGGENIYPSEVERELMAVPGLLDAAVVAVPDERWGEVGAAFVVVAPDSGLNDESIRELLNGRLASFKIPRYVHFVDQLPKTATGQIRKSALRMTPHIQEH